MIARLHPQQCRLARAFSSAISLTRDAGALPIRPPIPRVSQGGLTPPSRVSTVALFICPLLADQANKSAHTSFMQLPKV